MWKRKSGLIMLSLLAAAVLCMTVQPASAEIQTGRFKDYQIEKLENNEYSQTIGMTPYVWDGSKWVDRIIQNNSTHYNVYSDLGSFSFNKSTCTITQYKKGFDPTTKQAHDSDIVIGNWFWTIARKNGANPWQIIDASTFTCNISSSSNSTGKYLTMTRTDSSSGSYLKVDLMALKDRPVEDFTTLYMNKTAWNGNKFAFVLWAKDVKADSLAYRNGTSISIPQGQTIIDKSHLTVDSLDFVKNGNAFYFDWMKAKSQFKTIILNKTGSNTDVQFGFNDNPVILNAGQKMTMDPTYGYTAGSAYSVSYTVGAGAGCLVPASKGTASQLFLDSAGGTGNPSCIISSYRYSLASIPTSATVTSNPTERTKASGSGAAQFNCDIVAMAFDPATQDKSSLAGDIHNGTTYAANSTTCNHNDGVFYTVDLGATAKADLQTRISTGAGWFATGRHATSEVRGGAFTQDNITNFELTFTYLVAPDAITDLDDTDFGTDFVDLAFSAPGLNGGTLQLYMFNYTTPCGTNPLSQLPNGTTAISYTVSNLTPDTCYTFRATAATEGGTNVTGANIVNVTTLAFNEANYTIGSFSYNAQNPLMLPIRYERIENGTQAYVNVTFANTINLACDLRYTYAGTNHTYHTISSIPVSASENEAQFRFTNSSNDIVTFRCWNQAGNQSANYVLTQTNFLLLQQIDDFRNGTYGTMGMFGAFDLISLIVVIIAMIGLNQKSENVAGFFCIVAVAVLAFFGIIQWYTALVAGLAVIIMISMAATRKD